MSKTLSAAILVLLIPSVALPKLLQQSCSAAKNEKNGSTGQLPDKCAQLHELGGKVFSEKDRMCSVSLPWLKVKYIGFDQYASTQTEEHFDVNLLWTLLKF